MKIGLYKTLCIVFVFSTSVSLGQTVNVGEVTVNPGTIVSIVGDFNNTISGSFLNDGDVYVYANWKNDGVVDFLSLTGLTRYVGANTQTISGNEFSYLYNAFFNNASMQPAFNLSGSISIANESNFTLGVVDTDNFGGTFQFEINANHVNTSDNSHVDGHVVKVGDNSFEYPIGDGSYFRFAGISDPDNAAELFRGKYFFEETNANYPVANLGANLELVDNAEHWTIERTSGNTNVLVTLSWRDVTTPNEILVAPFENIHIARWDNATQLWVDEGGVVDVVNQTVTSPVNQYGVFTFARVGKVLSTCTIYNEISPNDDSYNQYFIIDCIDQFPGATVKIFNRWGNTVYEATDYKNDWDGISKGRSTINAGEKLPSGTYYYVLDLKDGSPVRKDWLYITR